MSKQKREFTPEVRLSILRECEREGQTVTIRKYNLAPSLLQRWKNKYLAKGISGLNLPINGWIKRKRKSALTG